MDAGVLPLHVFQHDPSYQPLRLVGGESIEPSLTVEHPIRQAARVSLIIPTFFNRAMKCGALEHLLEGVDQSRTIRQLVLVAADGDLERLEPLRTRVGSLDFVSVACEPNRRSQSRNVGTDASREDFLLFLDDDMLLQDWRIIDVIVSELLEGQFDCALFPRRTYLRFPLLYNQGRLEETINTWRQSANHVSEQILYDPIRDGSPFKTMAFCFPGCFMLIRRSAFEEVGRFPEDFEGWGFEDTDFAMRAVRRLRVMNLFRRTSALVHIDHPVSPYKSEEYQKNLAKFYSAYHTLDMDWMCREVIAGDDFLNRSHLDGMHDDEHLPLREVTEKHLPVSFERTVKNYEHVLRERIKLGLGPIPETVVLHGSRGAGTAKPDSDYDVLFLFRGGGAVEHFVCQEAGPVVELEFSDFAKFEHFATAPAMYPMRGPLELAKLVQSRVLWGEAAAFEQWRSRVLTLGVKIGLPVWCLYGLGLCQGSAKLGSIASQYFQALRWIVNFPAHTRLLEEMNDMTAARHDWLSPNPDEPLDRDGPRLCEVFQLDPAWLSTDRTGELIRFARGLMDRELSSWRLDMRTSKRVFASQVPEIWVALRRLLADEGKIPA